MFIEQMTCLVIEQIEYRANDIEQMTYRAKGIRANDHRANGNRADVVAPFICSQLSYILNFQKMPPREF